ncbi:unnamed protein product [Acanthosepion pharaonis]|uniref:Uncharacterized protein n=1 Tax=Acanthosepion pharaonis TaxID=158019 RepID=A0A812CEH2_ACAPH|nr:unnamed protein product [Sepia pharaonis]
MKFLSLSKRNFFKKSPSLSVFHKPFLLSIFSLSLLIPPLRLPFHIFPPFLSKETPASPVKQHEEKDVVFMALQNFKEKQFHSSEIGTKSNISFCLLQLDKDVEDFEKRLRERIERTKQSIEQLSIDCDSKCSKIWQEFDAFLENTRLKAAKLCDQMKRKTTEEERKWRQSLQEKENLLEEAGKWRMDLRHLLVAGNDDEDVVSRVRSLGAELSSRLHESFTPVEEGHFVVTFPEWCQRSLNQLQEEIVDFTAETWYPEKLELQSECRLQDSNLWSVSIAGSDEDGHVIVGDASDLSIKEFARTGEVVGRYHFEVRGEKFKPMDISPLSTGILASCGNLGSEPGPWGQLQEISLQLRDLQKPHESRRDNFTRHSNRGSRSTSRHKYQQRRDRYQHDNCWYHENFGARAKKCRPPCSYKKSFLNKQAGNGLAGTQ